MKKGALVIAAVFFLFTMSAQERKKIVLKNDVYKGDIQINANEIVKSSLSLKHEPRADSGSFALTQNYIVAKYHSNTPSLTEGSWKTLKGLPGKKDTVILELQAKDTTLYFLPLKNGNLQELDPQLHGIRPVSKHILWKNKSVRPTLKKR